jgi:hypothetical protein
MLVEHDLRPTNTSSMASTPSAHALSDANLKTRFDAAWRMYSGRPAVRCCPGLRLTREPAPGPSA